MSDRRDVLVRAAGDVLLSEGLDGVTHRRVATHAGVPLGSTTYYFDSLDELRACAVEAAARHEAERASAVLGGARPRSTLAVARQLVDVVIGLDRLADRRQVVALYQRLLAAAISDSARQAAAQWQAAFVAVVDRFVTLHRLAVDPAALLALVDGRVIGWVTTDDPADALLRAVRQDLQHMVAGGSTRSAFTHRP